MKITTISSYEEHILKRSIEIINLAGALGKYLTVISELFETAIYGYGEQVDTGRIYNHQVIKKEDVVEVYLEDYSRIEVLKYTTRSSSGERYFMVVRNIFGDEEGEYYLCVTKIERLDNRVYTEIEMISSNVFLISLNRYVRKASVIHNCVHDGGYYISGSKIHHKNSIMKGGTFSSLEGKKDTLLDVRKIFVYLNHHVKYVKEFVSIYTINECILKKNPFVSTT